MLNTKSGPAVPSVASHALSRIFALALATLLAMACTLPAFAADDDKKPDPKSVNDKDKSGKPSAPDSQPPSSDHEIIQLLTQQIQLLQARVKQLEEKDAAPASTTPASAPPAMPPSVVASGAQPTIAPAAPTATAASSAAPTTAAAAPAPIATAAAAPDTDVNEVAPRLHLNAYGDVGYQFSDQDPSSNSFELGSFDLFLTSRLSDKSTVLGEVIFLATPDNEINVDLERLMFQYKFNDYFQFGIGRYHTDIGYYNATFHHIQWFSTPIGRPLFLNFDDFGGFLPLQEVGLSMNGNIPSGDFGLHWVAEVGNGRSHIPDTETAQNRVDDNSGKSFNINISAHPKFLSGLVPGFSFYHDDLTAPECPKSINPFRTRTSSTPTRASSGSTKRCSSATIRPTNASSTFRLFTPRSPMRLESIARISATPGKTRTPPTRFTASTAAMSSSAARTTPRWACVTTSTISRPSSCNTTVSRNAI